MYLLSSTILLRKEDSQWGHGLFTEKLTAPSVR